MKTWGQHSCMLIYIHYSMCLLHLVCWSKELQERCIPGGHEGDLPEWPIFMGVGSECLERHVT